MLGKLLIHVHCGETLCGWQYRSKGEVVEEIEKEKEVLHRDQTLTSLGPDLEGVSPVRTQP